MLRKKILLFLLSLFLFISSSEAKEESFYLKKIISFAKVDSIKESDRSQDFNLDHQSELSPLLGIGLGYYIDKRYRIELLFENLNFNFTKGTSNFNYTEDDIFINGAKAIERKAHGKSLLLNGYMNIFDRESFKIFIGTGIGVIKIKEKVCHLISGSSVVHGQPYTFPLITETFISKSIVNFAYSLTIGTDIRINPDINLELNYSWKDFGKTKHVIKDQDNLAVKNKYKGHHLSIGIRFDL